MDKVIEMALEAAWDGCDAVYMSCELVSNPPRLRSERHPNAFEARWFRKMHVRISVYSLMD